MILAGIDEAGYGPLLGPLIVGCCAFEIPPDDDASQLPCVWTRLRKVVSKTRPKDGRRLHFNDSKAVYSPSAGLKELEKSVLALAATLWPWSESWDDFVNHVSADCVKDLAAHRWYGAELTKQFPLESDALLGQMMANALRADMTRMNTRCVHFAARVLPEKRLNQMLDATRNKSNTLFSIAAVHLDYLLRNFGDKNLVIFCDRQGGREHYGSLLRLMFDGWSLQVVSEGDGRSEYLLTRNQRDESHVVKIIFCEKAEAQCLPVAAASMLSKYLREALMRRFNAFWKIHLPEIAPTAGYYTDGMRFLTDIELKRRELGVVDSELIRSR